MKLTHVSRDQRVKNLMTTWLAVVATVTVAACSSSHGGGAPVQPQALASPTPAPYTYNARGPEQLDNGSGRSQQESPNSTDGKDDTVQFSDGTTPPAPRNRNTPPEEGARVPRNPRRLDPAGVTPTQANTSGPVQDSSGFVYGGASSDGLRAQIEAIPVSEYDLRWATQLSKARLFFTPQTREVQVDVLQTRLDGQQFKITLRGFLDRSGRGYFPDNGSRISGAIECLDINGGCETAHVKIVNQAFSLARTAHLIIRTTNASFHVTGNGFDIAHNHEYDWFFNILVNTATQNPGVGWVSRLTVETSETMHGVSNVAVAMDLLNIDRTESLDFFGPLVLGADGEGVNVQMFQTPANPPGIPQLVSNTISDIRMVGNDGRGEITVALTVRAARPGSVEDTATMRMNRIQNAIKSPTSL